MRAQLIGRLDENPGFQSENVFILQLQENFTLSIPKDTTLTFSICLEGNPQCL